MMGVDWTDARICENAPQPYLADAMRGEWPVESQVRCRALEFAFHRAQWSNERSICFDESPSAGQIVSDASEFYNFMRGSAALIVKDDTQI